MAFAEGNRSLGVTVSPVGGFVLSSTARGSASGYAADLGWSFSRGRSPVSVGGHVTASGLYTEATPLSVRVTPFPKAAVQPYLGVGASLMLGHSGGANLLNEQATPLRLGAEVAGGVGVTLSPRFFLHAEGRYQSFSYGADPLSSRRLGLGSAYLGLGFRL